MEQPQDNIPQASPDRQDASTRQQQLPARPIALPVSVDAIPKDLRKVKHWVTWQYEAKAGAKTPHTKVPYIPFTDLRASSTKRHTWRNFDLALKSYQDEGRDRPRAHHAE